jgi:hypothetical protein
MLNTKTVKFSTTPVSHPSDDEFDTLRDVINDEINMSECFDRNWPSWPSLFVRMCPQIWLRTSTCAGTSRHSRSKSTRT